ncbi:MAG: hypothetical protein IRY86_10540 [Thermorudis peleae]|nr:hypothetical protein [Thermorudis peleae]
MLISTTLPEERGVAPELVIVAGVAALVEILPPELLVDFDEQLSIRLALASDTTAH